MAIKKYGCYLKDGRFIELCGGFVVNYPNQTDWSRTDCEINKSYGDDFFPDLLKKGDVQYFASGAKAVVTRFDNDNDRASLSPSNKYFSNMYIDLYSRKGNYMGQLLIYGTAMVNNTYYQKMCLLVGVMDGDIDGYEIFRKKSYNNSMVRYFGTVFLGNNGKMTYSGCDYNDNANITKVDDYINRKVYKQGFYIQWVGRNPNMALQPPINSVFNTGRYSTRWGAYLGDTPISTSDKGSDGAYVNATLFYKFLGEVGLVESYIGEDLGEFSTTGGQDGTYTDSTDVIEIPSLPNVSASSCGLVKMYELSVTQAIELGNYLWSAPSEVIENLKKIMVKPMDSIISLQLSPINPPLGGDVNIKIGGMDSGVVGKEINNQYLQLDCGTVKIDKYWGNCLDFSPYTKASIYLPMIGTQILNVDDIMGKTIGVTYNIDILSGSVVAFVSANGNVLYNFQGAMNSQIPLTGADNANLVSSTIGLVASGVAAFATGGASVPVTATVASGLSVMNSKQTVQRGGTISASGGLLGVKFPYITIERAVQSLPNNFKHFKGYTSNITMTIAKCKGYTEIAYIDLNGIGAMKEEIEMLNDILNDGFYA